MKRLKQLSITFGLIMLILFTTGAAYNVLQTRQQQTPPNPISEISKNSSNVLLASTLDKTYNMVDYLAEEQNYEENYENKDNAQNKDNDGTDKENESDKDGTALKLVGPDSGNSVEQEYFTTTIKQGQIVTTPEYSFKIIQLNDELKVISTRVYVNQNLIPQFGGSVYLKEGSNSIRVDITYEDKDGSTFRVYKDYKVTLNTEDIIIYTDLKKNTEVYSPEFSFKAHAKKGKNTVPLKVALNGTEIKGESNQYKTRLRDGKNTISIQAAYDGKSVTENYNITYKKDGNIKIKTDLRDQEVISSGFSFYARIDKGGHSSNLKVSLNGKSISGDDNGNYKVSLSEGKNEIILLAKNAVKTLTQKYNITYNKASEGGDPEEEISNPNAPIFTTDLRNGMKVKNNVLNFYVSPKDHEGKYLGAGAIKIHTDAQSCALLWTNDGQVSYQLKLNTGKNSVSIRVEDKEGNWRKKSYIVIYNKRDEHASIGKATFSIEATTIGLGYLIPPTKVNIYPEENAAVMLDRILKERGFEYEYTGTIYNSFYLKRIKKKDLIVNPVIPEDLVAHLKEDADWYGTELDTDYLQDSLGEFDFCNGSGWMYSVNGVYPNYGFADSYLQDGDVVRIRFTLMYGSDIGGAGAMGGESSNYEKEW